MIGYCAALQHALANWILNNWKCNEINCKVIAWVLIDLIYIVSSHKDTQTQTRRHTYTYTNTHSLISR